jgi:meiotic recombination protein REC8
MQARTMPQSENGLNFDAIVPKPTSSKHIAAAAFHHCLGMLFASVDCAGLGLTCDPVLAGKDLIRVQQAEPYGDIVIIIV